MGFQITVYFYYFSYLNSFIVKFHINGKANLKDISDTRHEKIELKFMLFNVHLTFFCFSYFNFCHLHLLGKIPAPFVRFELLPNFMT